MSASRAATTTPAFSDATYATLFDVTSKKDRKYAEDIVAALGRIDPSLAAPPAPHPFGALIAAGSRSVDALIGYVEAASGRAPSIVDAARAADALDALAQLFVLAPATPAALARLRKVGANETDPARTAALAKLLAIGRDDELLFFQMRALADPDPAIVGSAARLLGYGRYAQALPILRALVSPLRFLESRAVLWAIGEIGDASALPELATALAQGFRVEDALLAVGKLRDPAGIGLVLPFAMQGLESQRVAAWQALATILDAQRGPTAAVAPLADGIAALIEAELAPPTLASVPPSMRCAMLLCLARLGRKLPASQVKRVLGIDEAQATTLAALMIRSRD